MELHHALLVTVARSSSFRLMFGLFREGTLRMDGFQVYEICSAVLAFPLHSLRFI